MFQSLGDHQRQKNKSYFIVPAEDGYLVMETGVVVELNDILWGDEHLCIKGNKFFFQRKSVILIKLVCKDWYGYCLSSMFEIRKVSYAFVERTRDYSIKSWGNFPAKYLWNKLFAQQSDFFVQLTFTLTRSSSFFRVLEINHVSTLSFRKILRRATLAHLGEH